MSAIERQAVFRPGASFFEDDGVIKFQYTSDASSIVGPRKATEQDKKDHAIAWTAFLETRGDQTFPQLDHDGDGKAGGSLPGPRRGRRKKVVTDDGSDHRPEDV